MLIIKLFLSCHIFIYISYFSAVNALFFVLNIIFYHTISLGDGYCRSEAAVAVLLTKRSMAKRVYATVINAGSNTDGFKEQGEEENKCW